MAVRFDPPEPPNAFVRWMFRVPAYFFRAGLGFLFGSRIIMLEHVGRTSGLTRYSCVEVVDQVEDGSAITIVSGYGERSQWYRNLRARPDIQIRTNRGRRAHRWHGSGLSRGGHGATALRPAQVAEPNTARGTGGAAASGLHRPRAPGSVSHIVIHRVYACITLLCDSARTQRISNI